MFKRFYRYTFVLGLCLSATVGREAHAQAPLSATIKLPTISGSSLWNLPATIEIGGVGPGNASFLGSNGKQERGAPLFSLAVESGATFYACATVSGFPGQTSSQPPPPNRSGGSSFIAVKTEPDGSRKIWINASVGAYKVLVPEAGIIADWEYQIRYFSGDPANNTPPSTKIGTVPNNGFFGGLEVPGAEVNVKFPDMPDLQAVIGDKDVHFGNGYRPGTFGSLSVLVTNVGPGKATAPIDVFFYLSSDSSLDLDDIPVGSASVTTDLPANTGQTVASLPFQIPAAFGDPNFYFIAAVDVGKKLTEVHEDNNNAIAQPPLPDLVPSLDFDFADPRPGRAGTVKVTVKNEGKGAFKGALALKLSVFREIIPASEEFVIPGIASLQITELKAGAEQTFSLPGIEIPKRILVEKENGPEVIGWKVKLDENNLVQELNDSNNEIGAFMTIKGYDLHGKVLTRGLKQPIEQVEIRVHKDSGNSAAPLGDLIARAFTDPQGNYRIEGLPYGDYLIEPFKDEWKLSGFDGALGDYVKLLDAVPGPQLVAKGDVEVITFYGMGQIEIKSFRNNFKGYTFFLPRVDLDVDFTMDVDWRGHEPGRIEIMAPESGRVLQVPATDDRVTKRVNVGTELGELTEIKGIAISKDGSKSEEADANCYIMGALPGFAFAPAGSDLLYYKLTLGPNWDVLNALIKAGDVPSSIPIFGGREISIRFIPTLEAEIHQNETKIGLKWEGNEKPHLPSGRFALGFYEFSLAPTLEAEADFRPDAGNWEWKGPQAGLSFSGEVRFPSIPLAFIPSPVPLSINLSAKGEINGKGGLESYYPEWHWQATASGQVGARGSLDAGFVGLLSGGGWLGGALAFEYTSKELWKKVDIIVNGGFTIYMLNFKYENELLHWEWDLKRLASGLSAMSAERPPLIFVPIERLYAEDPGFNQWLGGNPPLRRQSVSATRLLQTLEESVYPDSQSDLANGKTLSLAWVRDVPRRNSINRTAAVVSSLDKGGWSSPRIIADDGTADFHPRIAESADGLVATWEDAREALPDSADLTNMVQALEISVAVYNKTADQWTSTRLSANAYLDRTPRIAVASESTHPTVIWVSNPSNELFGTPSHPNELRTSSLVNGAWSKPELAANVPFPILTYDAIEVGEGCTVVLSLDTDGDLQTTADRELFSLKRENGVWGELQQLTHNDLPDDNPQFAIIPGRGAKLLWLQGGSILMASGTAVAESEVVYTAEHTSNLGAFRLSVSPEGRLAVVWPEASTFASDIWGVFYDASARKWSQRKQLSADEQMERGLTAAFVGEDILAVVYNSVYNSAPELSGQSLATGPARTNRVNLAQLTVDLNTEVAIGVDSLGTIPANAVPGESAILRASIENRGFWSVENLPVSFYVEQNGGMQIARTNLSSISAGSTVEVSVPWQVPNTTNPVPVSIAIDTATGIADTDTNNNSMTVLMALPDLALANLYWTRSGDNYRVTASVGNVGTTRSSAADLQLAYVFQGGSNTITTALGALAPGGRADLSFDIPATARVRASVLSTPDFDTANNALEISLPEFSSERLVIAGGTRQPGGQFGMSFGTTVGAVYYIEASTDFVIWNVVQSITATSSVTNFSQGDPPAASPRYRFFRVRRGR